MAAALDAVLKTLATEPGVEKARMFGSDGLKVGGKVFVMVVKGAFVAKLPKARVDALLEEGVATAFDPGHGRPMKEWVAVAGCQDRRMEIGREALRFVRGGARRRP